MTPLVVSIGTVRCLICRACTAWPRWWSASRLATRHSWSASTLSSSSASGIDRLKDNPKLCKLFSLCKRKAWMGGQAAGFNPQKIVFPIPCCCSGFCSRRGSQWCWWCCSLTWSGASTGSPSGRPGRSSCASWTFSYWVSSHFLPIKLTLFYRVSSYFPTG